MSVPGWRGISPFMLMLSLPAMAGTPPEGQLAKAPLFIIEFMELTDARRTSATMSRCFAM